MEIQYQIDKGRRFRLTDIRITGTNKLTFEDVEADLKSQKASAIGLIPFLGYGRGYTSLTLLEQDRRIVRNYMRELGYRRADVEVLQGVSIDGENLIITFNVTRRTVDANRRGGSAWQQDLHRAASARRAADRDWCRLSPARRRDSTANACLALYSREGYVNAQVDLVGSRASQVRRRRTGTPDLHDHLPLRSGDRNGNCTNEGDKVFINRIVVNGVTGSAKTQQTKRDAIIRAIPLQEGEVLRSDWVAESERELYLTDAYRQVIIHAEPAGETASGFKKKDVIIDVEEKKARVIDYGGGFSTDTGALGLFELSAMST